MSLDSFSIESSADAELLASLNKDIQNQHHHMRPELFKPHNYDEILGAFKTMLTDGKMRAYVAYEDKVAIGYVLFYVNERRESPFTYALRTVYIDQIFVNDRARKGGIGSALVEKVKDFARENEIKVLQLDHWTDNVLGRRFFGQAGFTYYNERMELNI